MVTQHFGSVAASTVRGFGAEQYPLLLVSLKNRSAMEICSVLQGNKKSSVCYILTVENARALIAGSVFLHYMKIPVMMQLFKYLILHVVGFNFAVHTTLWKRVICCLSTLLQRNLKTQQSPVILDLCLRKTQSGKSRDYRDVIVFEKLRFQNVFHAQEKAKPTFSNSSGLKSVFIKLRFHDKLVWTAGLTVEINERFQIPPA